MISSIGSIPSIPSTQTPGGASAPRGSEFAEALENAVASVEGSLDTAATAKQNLLNGKPEELHSVVMKAQRAELEFELFLEVRNKVVQAYQEVMRTQV